MNETPRVNMNSFEGMNECYILYLESDVHSHKETALEALSKFVKPEHILADIPTTKDFTRKIIFFHPEYEGLCTILLETNDTETTKTYSVTLENVVGG